MNITCISCNTLAIKQQWVYALAEINIFTSAAQSRAALLVDFYGRHSFHVGCATKTLKAMCVAVCVWVRVYMRVCLRVCVSVFFLCKSPAIKVQNKIHVVYFHR